jgi:hypothetical protein
MLVLIMALVITFWYLVASSIVLLPAIVVVAIVCAIQEAKAEHAMVKAAVTRLRVRSSVAEQHRIQSPNAVRCGRRFDSCRTH